MAVGIDLRVSDSFHGEFDRIKARFLAKGHILAIKDCRPAFFKLPPQERLVTCGVPKAVVLDYLNDPAADTAPPGATLTGCTVPFTAGCMIPVAKAGRRSSVILVLNQFPREFHATWVNLFRICVLFHELGRAEDFRCGTCYDHSMQIIRTKEAEEYACAFAKRYLGDILCERSIERKWEIVSLWDWYDEVRSRGQFVA